MVFEYSDNPKNPTYLLYDELPTEVRSTINDSTPVYGKLNKVYPSPRFAKTIMVYKLKLYNWFSLVYSILSSWSFKSHGGK